MIQSMFVFYCVVNVCTVRFIGLNWFLNWVHTSNRPISAWYLEIDLVHDMYFCVCISTLEAINNLWYDVA